MIQRILEAGEIESLDTSAISRIRTPERLDVFGTRAARLRQLAARNNPIAAYLQLMAILADAQQAVVTRFKAQRPSADLIASAQAQSLPLIPALSWVRDPGWHAVLLQVLDHVEAAGVPPPLEALIAKLRPLDLAALDAQADAIFAQQFAEVDRAAAPFIFAALQVVWTDLAADIDKRDVPYIERLGLCPVCGSQPVASTVHVGGAHDNYRFLQCELCATEWHMVRAKCSNCDSTKGIAYHALGSPNADTTTREVESKKASLKAESCDECRAYRKIGYQDRDYDFEPFADDLASLTLDIAMGEAGYRRASIHPWLWPDDGNADDAESAKLS